MEPETFDLAAVVSEIKQIADDNTASGMYTAEFEDELRSHFALLLDRDDGRDRFDSLQRDLQSFAERREFSRARIDNASGLPGGAALHKTVGKIVSRQVNGLVAQLNDFSGALMPVLRQFGDAVADPAAHVHTDLVHELDTVQERLAALERVVGRVDAIARSLETAVPAVLAHVSALDGLAARLEALETAERRRAYTPTFSSVAFGDATRGDADSVRAEYTELATRFAGSAHDVIDIGAGRGEFLELLREAGVHARGVELDGELAALAVEHGLDVTHGDGLAYLREQPLGSLSGIVLLHVIEHLHPNELLEMLSMAYERLAVGGRLVMETPNPQSLYVYARAFYLDPTHSRPVHPTFLEFVVRDAGFRDVRFEWTAFPADNERLRAVPGDDAALAVINDNVERVNSVVFAAQNYRVVATR